MAWTARPPGSSDRHRSRDARKAAGTLTSDRALARRYLELGCTFVAVGVEALLYAHAARRLAADFLGMPTTTPISAQARGAY